MQVDSRITELSLAEAEKLIAVQYSPEQRELVLLDLEDQIDRIRSLRNVSLPNALAPAAVFDPRLPGMDFELEQRPIMTSSQNPGPLPEKDEDIAFAPLVTLSEGALLQAQIPRIVYGSRSFRWIKEVRFARDRLDLEGPLMQRECRNPFVQWVKDIGRTEILDSEDL